MRPRDPSAFLGRAARGLSEKDGESSGAFLGRAARGLSGEDGARASRLVIATGNPGKLAEFEELIGDTGLELVAHDTGVAEDGDDYLSNALIKARAARAASGLPALGDDSGLELEALGGYPGLHSARIAPTQAERTALLMERLSSQPRPWRARFVCAIALSWPDGSEETFIGQTEGEVIPSRGSGGFGYDPVFLVPEAGRTFAEMGTAEKHRFSHRGAAVRALLASGALRRVQEGG